MAICLAYITLAPLSSASAQYFFDMHSLRILLLCTLLWPLSLQAQRQAQKSPLADVRKAVKQAGMLHRQELYHEVLQLLQPLWATDSSQVEMNYYLGIAYLNSRTEPKSKALRHLLKVPQNKFRDLDYHMATAYHYSHRFGEAVSHYKDYLGRLNHKKDADKIADTQRRIEQCHVGERLLQNPIETSIANMGSPINTPFPEYCPVVTPDGQQLFFTSRRPECMGQELDPLYNLEYEDIFYSHMQEDGAWASPLPLPGEVNTLDHDAAVAISPDAQTLYLYKSHSNGKLLSGDLYASLRVAGGWSAPSALPQPINSTDWETHTTVTADNHQVYFSSNRPGSLGGKDLYVVRKLPDGSWALPQNLGPELNTPYDEESPFIHPNGKVLYFSSKGHDNMGGYDIFYANWDEQRKRWSKPINIGYPINTADDDVYFSISADGTKGYFSSSREDGLGGQDLYTAQLPGNLLNLVVIRGKVTAQQGGRLPALVEVYDNVTGELVAHTTADNLQGYYVLFLPPGQDYGMRISHPGHLFKSLRLDMREQFTFIELEKSAVLQPIGHLAHENLENLFFSEYGDLKVSSDVELKALAHWTKQLPKTYQMEVAVHEIIEPGQDSLLVRYSTQSQVDVLLQQLREMGVADAIGQGYGFGNAYPIGNSRTERGRNQNRRREYILRLREPEPKPLVYEQLPDFKPFKEAQEPIDRLAIRITPEGDTLLVTQPLLFSLGGVSIDSKAQKVLQEVLSIMDRFPFLRIQICGHTDNTGTPRINMTFGLKRAEVILQQLLQQGAERGRLSVKSYGDTRPEASNATEEGRRKNRRVVFRITSNIPPELIERHL